MLAGHDKIKLNYKLTGPMLTATEMGWGGLGLGKEKVSTSRRRVEVLGPVS